jgi:hypothetical protein
MVSVSATPRKVDPDFRIPATWPRNSRCSVAAEPARRSIRGMATNRQSERPTGLSGVDRGVIASGKSRAVSFRLNYVPQRFRARKMVSREGAVNVKTTE